MGALDVPRRLLMGSGPSNPEPRVLQALAAPPLAGDDPALRHLLDDVGRACKAVFGATHGQGLAVAGASRSGIEAALASVIVPRDRVLVGVYGHFGELLCTLATLHGGVVERCDTAWGTAIDVTTMVDRIRHSRPAVVAVVHADTSTGIVQPLAEIGQACRETDALFLVDAVLSIGGYRVDVEEWSIDLAIGGLQKCLGGPPGLAVLTLSERARGRLEKRAQPVDSPYLDLARLLTTWSEPGSDDATQLPVPMLSAAREALGMVLDEGLPDRWRRHRTASDALRAGLQAMGLELFADAAHRVPMVTLVRVPDGIDETGVREQLLTQHGIEIMAAFGPLRGKVWRIGTMGTNAALPSVLAVLAALETVLARRGASGWLRGAAVDAAVTHYDRDVARVRR